MKKTIILHSIFITYEKTQWGFFFYCVCFDMDLWLNIVLIAKVSNLSKVPYYIQAERTLLLRPKFRNPFLIRPIGPNVLPKMYPLYIWVKC